MYFAGIAALAPQHAEASERLPGRGSREISGRTGRGGVRVVVVALSDHGSGEDGGETARAAAGPGAVGVAVRRGADGVGVGTAAQRKVRQPAAESAIGAPGTADSALAARVAVSPRRRVA